ncbi:MAG: hypothetical protein SGJ24_06995 [Chloroflexota bacterium]|nr:hypothetical protein [Chloroflexota bacterium]
MTSERDFSPLLPLDDVPDSVRGCLIERLLQENAQIDHDYFYTIHDKMIGILIDHDRSIDRDEHIVRLQQLIKECRSFISNESVNTSSDDSVRARQREQL